MTETTQVAAQDLLPGDVLLSARLGGEFRNTVVNVTRSGPAILVCFSDGDSTGLGLWEVCTIQRQVLSPAEDLAAQCGGR